MNINTQLLKLVTSIIHTLLNYTEVYMDDRVNQVCQDMIDRVNVLVNMYIMVQCMTDSCS